MKRLILIALMGLAAAKAAQADIIYVQGDVSGTWAADTVMVTGEVRVSPGQTLVIQPGVEVLFQVYCKFIVDSGAVLSAVGNEIDSIRFDVLTLGTNWHGIHFMYCSDFSILEYCSMTNGLASGGSLDDHGGALFLYNSNLIISHNRITANQATDYGGGICCYYYSHPLVIENIIENNTATKGGGIYCHLSDPYIIDNEIQLNHASSLGGGIDCISSDPQIVGNAIVANQSSGIYCQNASPSILHNIIYANLGLRGAGIYCYYQADPLIWENIIMQNVSTETGGGILSFNSPPYQSNPMIIDNIIAGNSALSGGGGLYLGEAYYAVVKNNTIIGNTAPHYYGGGMFSYYLPGDDLTGNLICGNTAQDEGGGIHTHGSVHHYRSTIVGNAANQGGAFYHSFYNLYLKNDLVWDNSQPSIYPGLPSDLQISYSDCQDTLWPGLGNINIYPAFVDTAHDDYRLLWGSPCIDTGDPNPIYNDPDGTRADMGAFYYDQSVMVRILLSPHEIPYLIPETGGSMDYTIRAFNRDSLSHAATVWCEVTLPDSSVYGPVLGPVTVTLGAGALLERVRTQNVPAVAPMGVYHYNAYAVAGSDTSKDNFMWGKLGTSPPAGGLGAEGLGLEASSWTNTGEPITDVVSPMAGARSAPLQVTEYRLLPCSPNPFNATAILSYQLPVAGHVRLQVYDVAGRMAETLVNGWREAGIHEVTFDAADLPSGMYFCRIQAGEFEAVEKIILLK